jgi:hypothetical protein
MKATKGRCLLAVAVCGCCVGVVAAALGADGPAQAKAGWDKWTYIHADGIREPAAGSKAGDFGISFDDLHGDGLLDIVSGHYFYRNPGGGMTSVPWPRVTLPNDPQTGKMLDAGLLFNVTGSGPAVDILAEDLPNIVWLHANDPQGS